MQNSFNDLTAHNNLKEKQWKPKDLQKDLLHGHQSIYFSVYKKYNKGLNQQV